MEVAALNWNEGVAIATGGAAAVTAAMAYYTRALASKTSQLAAETAKDVRSSARAVLLDPARVADARMEFGGGHDSGSLAVIVHNAGPGPALNVDADIYIATTALDRRTRPMKLGNVAPNTPMQIVIVDVPDIDVRAWSGDPWTYDPLDFGGGGA